MGSGGLSKARLGRMHDVMAGYVERGEVPETPLVQWRAADTMMVVERPNDELCREASRLGALLVAEIAGGPEELESEARRLARWPAVAVAL